MRRKISSRSILKWQRVIVFILISFMATDVSYAMAVLSRIQQNKAKRQQPTQAEYQKHQQQQAQKQPAAQPTYQDLVDQRNQAIAQAILNAHNKSALNEDIPFGNDTEVDPNQQVTSNPGTTQQPATSQEPAGQVQDVVDLAEVWKKLDTKSTVWTLLIDDQTKVLTVSEYIDRFHKQGVKISAPPLHYAQMIDEMVKENPQILERPFGELLQILAIVDYDFDNGMDKDVLARKILGDAGYEANRKRFTQQAPRGGAGS